MNIPQSNKELVLRLWRDLDAANTAEIARYFAPNFHWMGMAPIHGLTGSEAYLAEFWNPFRKSFGAFWRETHILIAGLSNATPEGQGDEGQWVGATGYFIGTQTSPFLGIPARAEQVRIRWGEFLKVEAGQIADVQFQLDLVDWCEQLGINLLPKPRGASHVFPAPTAVNGVLTETASAGTEAREATAKSLALGRALIYDGLNEFDQEGLESMGMRAFFHENLKWYGPGGIGACLSMREFEELHQEPWLIAFPDRKVRGLESLFAEGNFVAGSGVAGVIACQSGPYLGHPAKGAQFGISGLDFWLRTGDKFTENWVFVDMIKMFADMGYDLLARLR